MKFENFVKENKDAFLSKVKQISSQLGINPDWLMAIMYHESELNSHIQNSIGATGLIQFMPKTAASLGTSGAELKQMSNVKQLDYVYKYFAPSAGRIKTKYDLFLITFLPVALGKPDDWVFQTSDLKAGKIASQNAIFDLNKDGVITMKEYKEYLNKWFNKYAIIDEIKDVAVTTTIETQKTLKKNLIPVILISTGVAAIIITTTLLIVFNKK